SATYFHLYNKVFFRSTEYHRYVHDHLPRYVPQDYHRLIIPCLGYAVTKVGYAYFCPFRFYPRKQHLRFFQRQPQKHVSKSAGDATRPVQIQPSRARPTDLPDVGRSDFHKSLISENLSYSASSTDILAAHA